MVCVKCQKKLKATELATPGDKRKNEMYYARPVCSQELGVSWEQLLKTWEQAGPS